LPLEKFHQQDAVLLYATFTPTVREIENNTVKKMMLDGFVLL